jgi:hypothetical protein
MRRREFLGVLGSAAAWPLAARAQKQPERPVIGLLAQGGSSSWNLAGVNRSSVQTDLPDGHAAQNPVQSSGKNIPLRDLLKSAL